MGNNEKTTRAIRMRQIGLILDRLERMDGRLPCERFDLFIDIDVSKVNTEALLAADDGTFLHDVHGIYNNLVRNGDEPEKSELRLFAPRVGFAH